MRQILNASMSRRGALCRASARSSCRRSLSLGQPVPVARAPRKSAAFLFTADNSDQTSPRIYSSRVAKAELKLAVKVTDPTRAVPVGVDGQATFKSNITFADDPLLSANLLTGGSLVDHMLTNPIEDVGRGDDPDYRDVSTRVRPRIPDRIVFDKLIQALRFGCG